MSSIKMFAMVAMTAIPLSASAGTFTTLYTFTGGADYGQPTSQLIYRDGALYGVTPAFDVNGQQLGNIFKFDLKSQSLTVMYDFKGGTDGNDPNDLIYHAGMFYGTTLYGGVNDEGTVFALDTKTGKEAVLYNFINPGNGNMPFPGGLIFENGMLYGVARYGGTNSVGMIFAVNPTSGAESTVFNFNTADGNSPNPSLVFNNGLLYGTTLAGGSNTCAVFNTHAGCGVMFSIDPATSTESIVYSFAEGTDGFWPASNLIYHKGLFYGGTEFGGDISCGRDGCGTLFSVNSNTGDENVVNANTGLAQIITGLSDHGRSIYETLRGTFRGRHINFGELVKFDLASGHATVLHKFTNGADGSHPYAPLTYHGGVYYGATTAGGNSNCFDNVGCGTIFRYAP